MIHAALQGKLSCLDSEDALTSAVFTRLRYLQPQVLGEWFATARSYADPATRFARRTAEPEVEFWPSVKDTLRRDGWVQPDIVLRFGDEILVIEAKLWSSKSQTSDGLDQLARQWRAIVDHYGTRARVSALVYLTPHLEPPNAELAESAQALGADASCLWWLSWSNLAPILEQQRSTGDRVSLIVADDLLAYMARIGLLRFQGWRLAVEWRRDACWNYRRRLTYWRSLASNNQAWKYCR